jgi:adenine phosphoribosyltransferase
VNNATAYAHLVRDVPDFPKPGILFKDITPVLGDAAALPALLNDIAAEWTGAGITKVLGVEARGFLLAPGVAERLGCGVALARKPGKLPWTTYSAEYSLEYGTDSLEMHVDAVGPADRVLVVDDVLATGGTARAAISLVASSKAHCAGAAFVIELGFLGGRATLGSLTATSLLTF